MMFLLILYCGLYQNVGFDIYTYEMKNNSTEFQEGCFRLAVLSRTNYVENKLGRATMYWKTQGLLWKDYEGEDGRELLIVGARDTVEV